MESENSIQICGYFLDKVDWKESECINIKSAVLIGATDEHVDEMDEKFFSENKKYLLERTTDSINIGVIDCVNFTIDVY